MINILTIVMLVDLLEKLQIAVDGDAINDIITQWIELKELDTNLIPIYTSWVKEGFEFKL